MSSKKRGILGGVMRGLGHVGKKPVRFKYEIYIDRLYGLRNGRYKVRFSRGAKGVETNVKAMDDAESNTMVIFEQKTLGMYTTLYRDEKGKNFDIKDFKLTLIEVRNDGGKRTDKVVGATGLNLGDFAGVPSKTTDKTCKLGASVTASVRITSTYVVGGEERQDDDAISESPLSGVSFDEEAERSVSDPDVSGSLSLPSESGSSHDFIPQPKSGSSSLHSGTEGSQRVDPRADLNTARVEYIEPVLASENEQLKRDLEEKERELQKYSTLVRSVSAKSMETQLEAEAKLEELRLLNDNLVSDLERARVEAEDVRSQLSNSMVQPDDNSSHGDLAALEEKYMVKITSMERNLKTLQDEKRAAKSKIRAHEHHQERLKATYKSLSDMYNKLRADYASLAKKYKSAKVKAVSSQTTTLQAVAHELEREKIRRERDDVMYELNRMRTEQQNDIDIAKRERTDALKELEELKDIINFLEETETELQRIINERAEKARDLETLNADVVAEVAQVRDEKRRIEEELSQGHVHIRELEEYREQATARISELEAALDSSGAKERDAVGQLAIAQQSQEAIERARGDEIGALKTERDKLLNELVVASKKNKELQASGEDRAMLIDELEALRRQMDDDKRRHERELHDVNQILDQGDVELRSLSEQLETAMLKMELAENSFGAEIKGLQTELDESFRAIQQLKQEHERALESKRNEKDDALARIKTLEKENQDCNVSFSTKLEKSSRELEEMKAKTKKDMDTLVSTHAVKISSIEQEYRDKYGRVCQERDGLQKNLFELSEKLDSARADLEVSRESMKNEIQGGRVELDAAIQEIDRLSRITTELEERNDILEERIAKLDQAKAEVAVMLDDSESRAAQLREEYRKKLSDKQAELDGKMHEQELLERELRRNQENHAAELDSMQTKLTKSLDDARISKSKLESQLERLKREQEEISAELELVQQQNYEERTQTLAAEVSKAREERDAKEVALASLDERRVALESSIASKDATMKRIQDERDQYSKSLEDTIRKNKLTIQEIRAENARAFEDEEARRTKLEADLKHVRDQLTESEYRLKAVSDKDYDGLIDRLREESEGMRQENKSVVNELDQTKALLSKRVEKLEQEKSRASRDLSNLKNRLLETEAHLEDAVTQLQTAESNHAASLGSLTRERDALTLQVEEIKRLESAHASEISRLKSLEDHSSTTQNQITDLGRQKEELENSLAVAQRKLSTVESERASMVDELKVVKRDSAAEIKRAQAERDDAVILLQKTRSAAKGNDAETGRLRGQIDEYDKKLSQASLDTQRLRDERDKVLKEMDDLQASLRNQQGTKDAVADKKGRNTEAQLRAAYARERTLKTRVTALIEENKVLKDGIRQGDSFDAVLNDLVQVKVALAMAEEDKLLLRDELRKYKGTDVI